MKVKTLILPGIALVGISLGLGLRPSPGRRETTNPLPLTGAKSESLPGARAIASAEAPVKVATWEVISGPTYGLEPGALQALEALGRKHHLSKDQVRELRQHTSDLLLHQQQLTDEEKAQQFHQQQKALRADLHR